MPGLLFTNTLMLAGLAALAVPVLIHLLLKRRKKRLQFSTIRFFQQQDEQSSRRRKLRNWLLLALRLLIVTLLVLAFARPFSRQSQVSATGRKQRRVVFVLDRSASMLATGTEGQRWALAKQGMQRVLSGLDTEDTAALIECATHANVLSGFAPAALVAQVLRELAPAYGTSSLADGLQQAVRLASGNGPETQSTIYLVSDLQKSACRSISSIPIPQQIEVKVLPVGDLSSPNLAIVRLDVGTHEGEKPQASIASFSDEDTSAATFDLTIDDRRVTSQALSLKAGAATNVELVIPILKPGWHDLTASLRTRDSLEADNTRYACLFVPEPAHVLIVEPRTAARVFEQEMFFLTSALDPTADSTNATPGSFNLAQVSPEELAGKLGAAKPASPWNAVVLPGLKNLPVGIGNALRTFVEGGGGLVLFVGDEMSANQYNGELAALLPARVGNVDSTPGLGSGWRIALYDTNSLVFSAFRLPNSGDLQIPAFTKRYELEALEGTSRLAFFEDGVPLVLARTLGRGRVALVNTSADTAWNDWPKHKTYVPFVHGLAKYVAQTLKHEPAQDDNGYLTGEVFELETGTQGRSAQFTLRAPDGKETRLTADTQGRLPDPGMTSPGTYSLRDNNGHEVRRMAVNLPAQESNLEALRSADFQHQLVRVQDNPKQTLAAGLFGSHNDQREFWTALLLGALILLLVEPFVANRTSV